MTFNFSDEAAPATVRKTEENPFVAVVASMESDSGKAKGFDTENNTKNLAKVRRQLTAAGDAADKTVRWTTAVNPETKLVHVTFYAVSKIKRGATTAAPVATPTPAPVAAPADAPAPAPKRTRTAK